MNKKILSGANIVFPDSMDSDFWSKVISDPEKQEQKCANILKTTPQIVLTMWRQHYFFLHSMPYKGYIVTIFFFAAELLQRPPLMLLAIKEKMQGFKETGIYDINKIGLLGKSVQPAFRPQPPQRWELVTSLLFGRLTMSTFDQLNSFCLFDDMYMHPSHPHPPLWS